MFNIVLVSPRIAPNTGNIIRLCANTGARLHLVEPLGFELTDARLRRAGLDYHDLAQVTVHSDWSALVRAGISGLADAGDVADAGGGVSEGGYAFTAGATRLYTDAAFDPGCALVFGTERTGLSDEVLGRFQPDQQLRLPMMPGSRSLNLSNAVAVVTYEAWRQQGFERSVLRSN